MTEGYHAPIPTRSAAIPTRSPGVNALTRAGGLGYVGRMGTVLHERRACRYESKTRGFDVSVSTACSLAIVKRRAGSLVADFFRGPPNAAHPGVAIVTIFRAAERSDVIAWHEAFDAVVAVARIESMGVLFLVPNAFSFFRSRNVVEIGPGAMGARFVDEKLDHSPNAIVRLARARAVGYAPSDLFAIPKSLPDARVVAEPLADRSTWSQEEIVEDNVRRLRECRSPRERSAIIYAITRPLHAGEPVVSDTNSEATRTRLEKLSEPSPRSAPIRRQQKLATAAWHNERKREKRARLREGR